MKEVYLDYNATTPIHPAVAEAIKGSIDLYGNASSHHGFGEKVRTEIEKVREILATFIGASADEIIFTSGGSESNNLVIKGVTCEGVICKPTSSKMGRHVITTQIEHPSVLNTTKCLESTGYHFTYLPVDQYGMVDPGDVEKAITPNTILISVMLGNNEVGTLQPISEIGKIARERNIHFHTDAVQAVGKLPLDVDQLGVDFLSLSGHKLYGPKGVGALYVRKGAHVCPLVHGGHQEQGRRGGTENTLGIIGLGKAIEVAREEMEAETSRVRVLRDRLETGITKSIDDIRINGHPTERLPGTLNVSFKFIEGESILYRLAGLGIAVSTGSACSSGSLEPSHVLLAMKLPHEEAHGSIRFSLGLNSTEEDVDYVLEHLPRVIQDLREMSPLYHRRN